MDFITRLQSHFACCNDTNSNGVSFNCKATVQTIAFLRVKKNYTIIFYTNEKSPRVFIVKIRIINFKREEENN